MFDRKSTVLAFVTFVSFAVFGQSCGSSTSGATVNINLSNALVQSETAQLFNPFTELFSSTGVHPFITASVNASSNSTDLVSLKYIVGAMQICQDLTTNGSQFSGGSGCVSLYSDSSLPGDLQQITASNYSSYASSAVDLMSKTSLATFNSKASGSVTAGSYQYVSINWSPMIAVQGSVTFGNGTTLTTQPCTIAAGQNGLCVSNGNTSLTTASSAQALVQSANGGTWFKFQNPFVISDDDVKNKTQFQVDMVFNPTGAIAGATNITPSGGFGYGSIIDVSSGAGNVIYVPMIQLSPMPKRSGDTTSKETYTIALGGGVGNTRVELYYNKADATKTVYGVNILTLLTPADTSGSYGQIDNGAKISTISTDASGALTLKATDGSAVVTGLTRGQNGTVTVNWLGGIGQVDASKSYTYVGTTDL